jgi:hypothetical protein
MAMMHSALGPSLQSELGYQHWELLKRRVRELLAVWDDPLLSANANELCEETLSGVREFVDSCVSQGMPYIPGFLEEVTELQIFLRKCGNRFPSEFGNAVENIPDSWHTARWAKCLAGHGGRPRFDTSAEDLLFWLEEGYNKTQIAGLYQVHRDTIARRLEFLGLGNYTPTSEDALASVISNLKDGNGFFCRWLTNSLGSQVLARTGGEVCSADI